MCFSSTCISFRICLRVFHTSWAPSESWLAFSHTSPAALAACGAVHSIAGFLPSYCHARSARLSASTACASMWSSACPALAPQCAANQRLQQGVSWIRPTGEDDSSTAAGGGGGGRGATETVLDPLTPTTHLLHPLPLRNRLLFLLFFFFFFLGAAPLGCDTSSAKLSKTICCACKSPAASGSVPLLCAAPH